MSSPEVPMSAETRGNSGAFSEPPGLIPEDDVHPIYKQKFIRFSADAYRLAGTGASDDELWDEVGHWLSQPGVHDQFAFDEATEAQIRRELRALQEKRKGSPANADALKEEVRIRRTQIWLDRVKITAATGSMALREVG